MAKSKKSNQNRTYKNVNDFHCHENIETIQNLLKRGRGKFIFMIYVSFALSYWNNIILDNNIKKNNFCLNY